MQKHAPSLGRILVAIGFALSCFGLLLFLWITFGGPTPFAAESYRFKASFPEAVTLAKQSEVRIGGVTVGRVEELSLPPEGNATEATIELDAKYGPIPADTRAILRQKTLLGETFIELTGGTEGAETLEDGEQLAATQTQDSVQIDEIFRSLDVDTRQAFRIWMQGAAQAIDGRGLDLNDALGNLGPFATDATEVLRILNQQQRSLRGLVRETGQVFAALTERDTQLASAITGTNATFDALASRDRSLAETVRILPTFEREARLTLNRLERFADDTTPLVRDLRPVARDLTPTLRSVRRLSPPLKQLFRNLRPLLRSSLTGLPELRRTLGAVRPVLRTLDPALANLNPIIRYLEFNKGTAGDFLGAPSVGFAATLNDQPGSQPAPRHALRVVAPVNAETLAVWRGRPAANRGNAYLQPGILGSPEVVEAGALFPAFDCDNTGGEHGPQVHNYIGVGGSGNPACVLQPDYPSEWGGGRSPQVLADP